MNIIYDKETRTKYDADSKLLSDSIAREKSFLLHTRWPSMEEKPTKPGMYLDLYHGRIDKDQDMTDWGTPGPLIGPCQAIHTTYMNMIRVSLTEDAGGHGDIDFTLHTTEDMIEFDGVFYGDWSVTYYGG